MITQIDSSIIITTLRILAVVLALVHFGIGLVMFSQMLSVSGKIKTSHIGCLRVLSILHIIFLAIVILVIIFI